MHPLAARALRTIRRHDLIPRGARVAAAVSGGSDSVAMLLLLRELEAVGEIVCAGVVHVNHQMRTDTAARDEAYCINLAARLSLPIDVVRVDIGEIARARRTSVEGAARVARYAALRDAMTRLDAVRVAVGHTRDDQAETFLLRMIRGAGSRGRRAILPRRGPFVRPVLDVTRAELTEYLGEQRVPFCHDETNDDVTFMRNRVRHELLPLLHQRFSPGVTGVLARNAEIASADEAYLSARARELFDRAVRADEQSGRVTVDVFALATAAPALAWRVAFDAMHATHTLGASITRPVGLEHAQALVGLASGAGPVRLDLPGIRAERIGSQLVLMKRVGRLFRPSGNSFRYALSIPGEVWLREAACGVTAHPASAEEGRFLLLDRDTLDGTIAIVSADALPPSLTVRSRRQGDWFRPLGLGGRKKLQDFFVDRKVGRASRDRVPLIVDDRDRIVWVAGHAISEEFRVPDTAQAVVILRLKTAPRAGVSLGGDGDEEQA